MSLGEPKQMADDDDDRFLRRNLSRNGIVVEPHTAAVQDR